MAQQQRPPAPSVVCVCPLPTSPSTTTRATSAIPRALGNTRVLCGCQWLHTRCTPTLKHKHHTRFHSPWPLLRTALQWCGTATTPFVCFVCWCVFGEKWKSEERKRVDKGLRCWPPCFFCFCFLPTTNTNTTQHHKLIHPLFVLWNVEQCDRIATAFCSSREHAADFDILCRSTQTKQNKE